MIPLRDDNPRQGFPALVIAVIAANALVFLYQLSLAGGAGEQFVLAGGAIPLEITTMRDLAGHCFTEVRGLARHVVCHPDALVPPPLTVVTAMFLHGGWGHLLGNMWFLWIFGDNLEDVMGGGRFVAFYLLTGVAAAALQVAVEPRSAIPMIGASGAIAGVLGGYARIYPHARVLTIVPIVIFIRLMYLPAIAFLGIWFLLQFLNLFGGGSGVAWYAHIGGFVAGFVLAKAFLRRPPRRLRPAFVAEN